MNIYLFDSKTDCNPGFIFIEFRKIFLCLLHWKLLTVHFFVVFHLQPIKVLNLINSIYHLKFIKALPLPPKKEESKESNTYDFSFHYRTLFVMKNEKQIIKLKVISRTWSGNIENLLEINYFNAEYSLLRFLSIRIMSTVELTHSFNKLKTQKNK